MSVFDIKTISFSGSGLSYKTGLLSFPLAPRSFKSESLAYVIRWHLSKIRSGSASTKTMSEISGTTAKPYKQKGTGNARHGSKRSVQFRGGRVCFGPRPRSYYFKIPKAIAKSSVFAVLRLKMKESKLIVFDGVFESISTSLANKFIKDNEVTSLLLLVDSHEGSFARSFRNIKNVKVINENSLNAYDMLKFDFIMISDNCLKKIREFL